MYMLKIHCAWPGVICNPDCISGIAMLTIEKSSTTIKKAKLNNANAGQGRVERTAGCFMAV
jgi:hypothetical protein